RTCLQGTRDAGPAVAGRTREASSRLRARIRTGRGSFRRRAEGAARGSGDLLEFGHADERDRREGAAVNNEWALLPMRSSNDLLGDAAGLRGRLEEDSYLYFEQVIDPARIAALRDDILDVLLEAG